MSRIGLKPIEIPAGVDVKVDGTTVTVKDPTMRRRTSLFTA